MEEEVQQPQEQQPEQPTEPRRHKRKFVRVLTNKYFIVSFVFAVIVLFVDRNNLIRWAGDYLEVLRQERVIRQYGRDIEELDRKLDQLTSDRDSLEKFAREEYYFHREDEEVSAGSAFAADIAFYYTNYILLAQRECMLSFGLNASNIGTKVSYDSGNTSQFLPTNLRLGASLLFPIDNYNVIGLHFDANKYMVPTRPIKRDDESQEEYEQRLERDYNEISPISGIFKSFSDAPGGFKEELQEIQWSLGLEYTYHDQFSVRGGYHWEHENKGNRKYFSFGAGFRMSVFSLDAAYLVSTAQSNPLDQTLRFSLGFDLDGIKDLFGRRRR